ncbi:MAG TPA: hypothetical protein DD400_03215 [Rhodospirillaceae bacterium]|nr:hypothetical protein [Rhodospirillaceae bacterium]
MAANNNNEDPVWMLLALCAIFVGALWGIWYFFKPELLEFMRYVRMAEIAPLIPFDKSASACFHWLHVAPIGNEVPDSSVLLASADCFGMKYLQGLSVEDAINHYNISARSIGMTGRFTGIYYRWIVLAGALAFSYYILFVSDKLKFKNHFNLETFIAIQAKVWPVIAPIVKFNPSKHSARILGSVLPKKLPTFAEALAPEEWLAFHDIPVKSGIPEKDRVRRTLLLQLGPRWEGYEKLPPYIMVLFAAFALKGAQKRDESDDFLGLISSCWSQKGGLRPTAELMAETKKILKDPEIGGEALAIANKHAYRTTAFLGVLKWARFMGGVLASAQFLWLRGVDRTLWYAGNNLGRRTFHMEGAGAIGHFMAEGNAQKALPIPRLDTTIITINQYLAANQPTIPPREDQDLAPL